MPFHIFKPNISAVKNSHLFDEIEAQTRAFFAGIGPLEGKEFVENFFFGKIGDARALIRDGNLHPIRNRGRRDFYLTAPWAEINGIA